MEALYVIDPTPVGDSLLDPVLAEIVQESKTLPTGSWVTRIARRGDEMRHAGHGPTAGPPIYWKPTMVGCSLCRGG